MQKFRPFLFLFVLSAASLFVSCQDQSLPPFTNETEINRWVQKEMKLWYYWKDKLPAGPDYQQPPASFFSSLIYHYDPSSRPDGDRFSWIQQSADDLVSSLSGEAITYGMEYRIVTMAALNKTMGSVIYVLPGSPADLAGVKRGDFFTQINDTDLTNANYRTLLSGTTEKKFTIATLNASSDSLESFRTASMAPVRFQEDPVHFSTVIEAGGKKTGYLVYHQFYPSSNGTNDLRYDRKLETIFDDFKNQHIEELIIDLRYNSGGYVNSAIHLGSLIAKNVTSNDIFAIKEYNPEISRILKNRYGADYFNDYFSNQTQNVGSLINRVFVLTSGRTASASELLINGLLPYMPVLVVGTTTVGKNVGSVTLRDAQSRTRWGIQPIVSKSFNSLMQSDYTNGFTPDVTAAEQLKLYAYGDERDPLLKAALTAIANGQTGSNARKAINDNTENSDFEEIGSSLSDKPGRSSMFETIPAAFNEEINE